MGEIKKDEPFVKVDCQNGRDPFHQIWADASVAK